MADKTRPLDNTPHKLWGFYARAVSVKDKDLTAPPGGEAEGDRYIVAAGATGAWSGYDNQIAEWHARRGGSATWYFIDPHDGFVVKVQDENEFYQYDHATTSWEKLSTAISTILTPYYEKHVVTAGEAASGTIDLTGGNTYTVGDDSLQVFRNGMLQCLTEDYTETDSNTVQFGAGVLSEGDILIFRWQK